MKYSWLTLAASFSSLFALSQGCSTDPVKATAEITHCPEDKIVIRNLTPNGRAWDAQCGDGEKFKCDDGVYTVESGIHCHEDPETTAIKACEPTRQKLSDVLVGHSVWYFREASGDACLGGSGRGDPKEGTELKISAVKMLGCLTSEPKFQLTLSSGGSSWPVETYLHATGDKDFPITFENIFGGRYAGVNTVECLLPFDPGKRHFKHWAKVQAHEVAIGMTDEEVRVSWGAPKEINRTVTSSTTNEQWIYGDSTYLYFESGVLTALQQ